MSRFLIASLLFFHIALLGQVRLCSWNLCDMGKSKADETIDVIAGNLKDFDVVALQEVVAGNGGAQSVARLASKLCQTGTKWEYAISPPTQGTRQKRERYAFLWKPSKVRIVGKPWLDTHFTREIEREPFFATFEYAKKRFTIVNFHAITKRMQPETEVKYFKFFPEKYAGLNLVFAGDFNCPQHHSVFNPIRKMGFVPALSGIRTTLKTVCKNGCTASEFDNIFYRRSALAVKSKGIVEFFKAFRSFSDARKISDHLPVWIEFQPN